MELGEFDLIKRLAASLPPGGDRLIAGIGDDAAVWKSGGYTLATTDTIVAGVHFLPGTTAWRDVGWKALASNLSDIAAMGGIPRVALVTICLPPDLPVEALDELYAGLAKCAAAYGVIVGGGDTVRSATMSVTIALLGDARLDNSGEPALLRRDAARAGDAIAVTGELGGSAGGLRVLTDGAAGAATLPKLIVRHTRPVPRISAGAAAVECGLRCGIDISDGLVQDLNHVCEASGVSADIWLPRIPLDPALVETYPEEAVQLAATGGEDYELVLVGAEDAIRCASAASDVALTIIGQITDAAGLPRVRLLDAEMREVAFPSTGWDHFRQEGRG